jgi:hypothetical protein
MSARRVLSLGFVPLLLLVMMLGAPTASAASLDSVTGGQTKLSIPWTSVIPLSSAHMTANPNGEGFFDFSNATFGPTIVFPISDGTLESSTMLGTVNHPAGLTLFKFNPDQTVAKTLPVTNLKIVGGAELVGNALDLVPSPTADLINVSHSKDPSTGVITFDADAQINLINATVLNTYFDTTVFTGGMILGHLKSTIDTAPAL